MVKKKSKRLKARIKDPSPVEEVSQEIPMQVAQVDPSEMLPAPSPPEPIYIAPAYPNVMDTILKVLQQPSETMYRGLSQRAQNELSPQEVRELRELFSIFDIGGTDRLSFPVLRKSLRTMGFNADDRELMGAIADCGIDIREGVTFAQFVDIVLIEQGDSFDVYEELMSGFTAMDIDRSGKITVDSLKKLSEKLDEDLSLAELEDMVKEADTSGNGEISHREFISVMLRTNLFRGTTANLKHSE